MERNIWIIKSIHEFKDKLVTNEVFAVTSEEEAEKDVLKYNKIAQDECRDYYDYKIKYYYVKISLFD